VDSKFLRFHKRTSDPTLAPLFNTYLQRLRGLYDGGVRFLSKADIRKHWRADLRISGEDLFVDLKPRDQAGFEFFTTGKPVSTGSVTQGAYTFTSLKACSVHVNATMEGEAVAWHTEIRGSKRTTDGREVSIIERPFQVQLIDEPVHEVPTHTYLFDRPKFPKLLFETWAPGTPHSGVHTRSATQGRAENVLMTQFVGGLPKLDGTLQGAKGGVGAWGVRDVLYDVPWMLSNNGNPANYALLNSDSLGTVPTPRTDWPRASGMQTVVSASHGTREFAIYIDAFNQVSVFPTGHLLAPSGINQTVAQVYVKTADMGLPAWVWQPSQRLEDHYASTGTTGLTNFPETDWKVNHLGTKAVAVCYTKVDAVKDDDYCPAISANMVNYDVSSTGVAFRTGSVSGDDTRHWIAPGLVEATITITLTGPNPEDYTLNVTSAALRDPATDTNGATLFAGYVWYDMADGSASAGDLCVWDIERYYRVPGADELGSGWWGIGSSVAYADQVRTAMGDDHEIIWGASTAKLRGLANIPHAYSTPPFFDPGGTADNIKPYANDWRRTLYSLRNLTKGTELRTLPGCPSGVAQGFYVAPDANGVLTLGSNVNAAYNDNPVAGLNPGLTYFGGLILVPVHSRSQFLKVDMTTLSFVMKLQVGTATYQREYLADVSANTSGEWFTLHPAVAVWTFNTHRETFFPTTMPDGYVAPSAYYTEPADMRVALKTRLNAIVTEDFRSAHMGSHTWTLLTLGNGLTDWDGSPEINALRNWANINFEGSALNSLRFSHRGGTTGDPSVELASWYAALRTYGQNVGLTIYQNPHFHWAAYADLISNAVMFDPMTCFFTHPNGTWAYFDQTQIYNTNGLPDPALLQFRGRSADHTATTGTSWGWNVSRFEHWIVDHVHLCFTLGMGRTVSKDTSFVELYNEAVGNLPPLHTETFNPINVSDLKATFTLRPAGTTSPAGVSFRVSWHGHDFEVGEDNVLIADPGFYPFQANGSTIDLNLNYLLGGQVPSIVATNRIAFSSCALIEAANE
jgi:hypothetical protein